MSSTGASKSRIIILGGGFAGVKCAEALTRRLSAEEAEIVLFNSENHIVFSPLLAEAVGSSVNPIDVVVPLRQLLPRTFCRTEEIQSIDVSANRVLYEADDGQQASMAYDHLVIACGGVTNLNVVPGMADHAFPLKSVADAAALRSQIMEEMEKAEVCSDPERRRRHLTFIVVGGGFSGAEAAGEINDLLRGSARYFRNWTCDDVKVVLLHSRDQILPEISPDLREFARRKMERAGVTIMLNSRVNAATPEGVGLMGGEIVRGNTIVCTIGSAPAAVLDKLKVPKEKGRLLTEPDLRAKGLTNVWVIGDCGFIINAYDNQPAPTTGQFAEREGTQCAQNLICCLKNQPTKPFHFKPLGELCSIGGHSAVADLFGLHLSGFFAWFVGRGVYLFKLPTWGRRFQVGFDWAWLLLFPRDLAHVRTRPTDRVSHAHYAPADIIIRRGDPPTNFYVLKRGEVEIVRPSADERNGEVVAVLGPGSFFGEKALLSDAPRVMTVRARTAVDVLVLGKRVFTQISGALTPLRDALAQSLNRRSVDVWKEEPRVHELLKRTPLTELMEPVPQPLLKPEVTLREVGHAFVQYPNEFFYVSHDGENIDGIVTITDLLRSRSLETSADSPVSKFMTASPVVLCIEDDCAIAATMFREYRLKNLPVVAEKGSRKLAGCLRVRRLMAYIFKELNLEHSQS